MNLEIWNKILTQATSILTANITQSTTATPFVLFFKRSSIPLIPFLQMFELQADARFSALSTARTDLNRRLEIYQSQYRTKEAQYAELGIVRKRNLEKVLRTLERQEHLSSSRKMNLDKDYERFQSQRTAVQSTLNGTSYAHRSLQQIQKTVSPVLIVNIHN